MIMAIPPIRATAANTNTRTCTHRRPRRLCETPLPHERLIHSVLCLFWGSRRGLTATGWVVIVDEGWGVVKGSISVIEGCFVIAAVEDCPNALLGADNTVPFPRPRKRGAGIRAGEPTGVIVEVEFGPAVACAGVVCEVAEGEAGTRRRNLNLNPTLPQASTTAVLLATIPVDSDEAHSLSCDKKS